MFVTYVLGYLVLAHMPYSYPLILSLDIRGPYMRCAVRFVGVCELSCCSL